MPSQWPDGTQKTRRHPGHRPHPHDGQNWVQGTGYAHKAATYDVIFMELSATLGLKLIPVFHSTIPIPLSIHEWEAITLPPVTVRDFVGFMDPIQQVSQHA